ncbi:hypothetical protein Vi05172_g2305 [Venturia inaequalis]|nr:hypothetical protein Vi05172_g2305 [Venturia inaequalis]
MSNPRDDAPDNGEPTPTTSQIPEIPQSNRSSEVSAATDEDANVYPPLPTQTYQSQGFIPVGMAVQSIEHLTNPIFNQRSPEANGLLSTHHLYAHQAPHTSSQQQHSHSPNLSADDELMTRALYEVRRQLRQDTNQSSQPAEWQNEFDENHDAGLIVSYDSPTFQTLYSPQAATQSLQHAFSQDRMTLQSPVMARRRSPTSPTQQNPSFNQYGQHGQPFQYHHHHAPIQHQQPSSQRQTEEVPSQKRQQNGSPSPHPNEHLALPVKEKTLMNSSQKRQRRDSPSQPERRPEQIGEEPSQKRPRRESQSQRTSPPKEQPRRVSNVMPLQSPQRDPSVPAPVSGESILHAQLVKPKITVSAKSFHKDAKRLLTASSTRYTTPQMSERHIAYDIASTLMLTGIYLDSKSSVDESAAWLEWAFSMEGIWKRRPVAGILHAVPEALLRRFGEVYGCGRRVPVFDGDGRVVWGEEGKEGGKEVEKGKE